MTFNAPILADADDDALDLASAAIGLTGLEGGETPTAQTDTPAFREWFDGSKVVDVDGQPLVVHHATFEDFAVFDRTTDIGFHFGSAKVANNRVDEAAKGRGRGDEKYGGLNIKSVYLSIQNPLHVERDPISWEPNYVLVLIGDAISQEQRGRILELDIQAVAKANAQADKMKLAGIDVRRKTQPWVGGKTFVELKTKARAKVLATCRSDVYAAIRQALTDAGYDGMTYINEIEGEGRGRLGRAKNDDNKTWIAFHPEQIKSAIGNNGDFDPSNQDIRFSQAEADGGVLDRTQEIELAAPDSGGAAKAINDVVGNQGVHSADDISPGASAMELVSEEIWHDTSIEPTATDSGGAPIAQTDTPAFKTWFGESKVVDTQGKPLVVYHGTQASFNEFDEGMQGTTVYSEDSGFFFTNDPVEASSYATIDWDKETPKPNVMPSYLSIKSPMVITLRNEQSPYDNPAIWYDNEGREAVERAEAAGNDGLIVRDERDDMRLENGTQPTLYVAFRPEQIKSALGNNGNFDPDNQDIRFSLAEADDDALDLAQATVVAALEGGDTPTAQTDTPAFREWFDGSKVVDVDGQPLMMYHGTKSDFNEFDIKKFGASDEGLGGKGFYFTYNPEEASGYALNEQFGKGDNPNVQPVYISLNHPFVITQGVMPDGRRAVDLHHGGINSQGGAAVRKLAEDAGHDGIIFASRDGQVRHAIAWKPEQIKSAIGNNGDFDPRNPDIRFSLAEADDAAVDLPPVATGFVGLENGGTPTVQTDTPAFAEWFGDSKVVDTQGQPLVVYHGTKSDITAFDLGRIGTSTDSGGWGRGIYFAADPEYAGVYAGRSDGANIVPAYVSLKNPLTVDARERTAAIRLMGLEVPRGDPTQAWSQQFADALRQRGHDGVLVTLDGKPAEIVAFRPEQIKTAIGNNGDFNPVNPDIRFSLASVEEDDDGVSDTVAEKALTEDEAAELIASDDNLFRTIAEYTADSPDAFEDKPAEAFKLKKILARITPYEPWFKSYFRGEPENSPATDRGRGFKSWSANKRTAEEFSKEYRNGVVQEKNGKVQAVALSTILTARMRLRSDENHYVGDQAESFVLDESASPESQSAPVVGVEKMNQESLLAIWLETEPQVKSSYALYGHPPMWETSKEGDLTLYSRPGRVQARPAPYMPYQEVNGLHYQWMRNGKWVGQGCQATFEELEIHGAAKIECDRFSKSVTQWLKPPPGYFDWSKRVNDPVLDLPFTEGVPTPEKAKALTAWRKANSDLYKNNLVKFYHATDPSLPIEEEGLKPTSASRRRSYQSTSGYVYLAATPERAKNFGDLGNQGRSVIYEVLVRVRDLASDLDQLNNQRASRRWGDIGNSIGESIVYGGGVRVKGRIEPWAIRKMPENTAGFEPSSPDRFSLAEADDVLDMPAAATGFAGLENGDTPTVQTDTLAFAEWFGDSKVVDTQGQPLVVYHGSPNKKGKPAFGEMGNLAASISPHGVFFVTPSYSYAHDFARGGRVESLYARIEKPVDLTDSETLDRLLLVFNGDAQIIATRGEWLEDEDGDISASAYFLLESKDVIKTLKQEGFDGAFIDEDVEQGVESFAVFAPNQIKSAIGNHGNFDPRNPDIRFSLAETDGEDVLQGGISEDKARIQSSGDIYESIPAGLVQHGYKLIPKGDSRRFKTFGTWEKDGVRIALSGNVLGVERGGVMVYQGDGDEMTLEALITDPELRGQGRAKAALQDLTRIADAAGKVLYLEPVQLEKGIGPDRARLQKMYLSAGFESIDSKGLVMSRSVSKSQQEQVNVLQDSRAADDASPDAVQRLQAKLAKIEAEFESLRKRNVRGGPEWDAVSKRAGAIRVQLQELTGDLYGRPKAKAQKPSDEVLNAEYLSPDDVPQDVRVWVQKNCSILTSDATDAVRWGRITDTLSDDRYQSGDLTIYRAVAEGDEIRHGDWVTTIREYADDHLARNLHGKGDVIESTVDGRDVLMSPTGNYEEAIYAPRSLSGKVMTEPKEPMIVGAPRAQTDTLDFTNWFNDSKVVDESGKPLVVYHGSPSGRIEKFRRGTHFGTAEQANTTIADRVAYWVGEPDPENLRLRKKGAVYPVYLSILNPKRVADTDVGWTEEIEQAKAEGHDGIVYKNEVEGSGDSWIAFRPEQVKSAIGNNGDFDLARPDIRFSLAEAESEEVLQGDQSSPALQQPVSKTPRFEISHAQMIARGAGGNLRRAFERYIPLDSLDGLEPRPANNESDDGEYHKGKPITQPIEVTFDGVLGVYMVYAGNHRIAQARANGQTYILAFVEPDVNFGRDYIGPFATREDPDYELMVGKAAEPASRPLEGALNQLVKALLPMPSADPVAEMDEAFEAVMGEPIDLDNLQHLALVEEASSQTALMRLQPTKAVDAPQMADIPGAPSTRQRANSTRRRQPDSPSP